VLQVGESDKSVEKKLSRSRFSFASFLLKRKEAVRFVLHVGESDKSAEKKLSRVDFLLLLFF